MTAPPPLLSAGRADRTRRAASTRGHGPSKTARSTIRPTPCGPWPASGTKDQEAEWATSMRVGHQHALRASGPHHANGPMVHMPDQSHAAHAKAHVRAGIADHPDGPTVHSADQPNTWSTRKPMRGRPRGPPLVHGPGRTMASLSTGPRSKDHMGRSAGGPGSCGPWPESPPPSGRSPQTHMERSHAHRAARPGPVPHPRQSTSRLPTVDVSPFGRSRHPPGAPCPASVRQPAPNKQRHNRHIREIKPDMKTSTQTDEKARHRNQKQRRQNQEPTQPATRYDAIRKPKKKHIPMQSPKEMDFLHPPPHGGRLSAELQRF